MINLRKVTEAVIPDGTITRAQLADNAVDASKIEDGAIDLTTAKVVGELPEAKLADNAVTVNKIAENAVTSDKVADSAIVEAKLANLSISTEKLKNNVVTLAKADNDIKITPFIGGEMEQFIEGVVPVGIIETGFSKVSGKYDPKILRIIASLKVEAGLGNEANLKVYIDEEITPRIAVTSISDSYELVNGEADVSDLEPGRHKMTVKIHSNTLGVKAYNDYIDILFIK